MSFSGWKPARNESSLMAQRFDEFGMTGCLNFYDTFFANTSIYAQNGGCEDLVNIVRSKGQITEIELKEAFADALDIDFSYISMDVVNITTAGNDCVDVSGGDYTVSAAVLSQCRDKGISVGEQSDFSANKIKIDSVGIGISAKDSSIISVVELDTLSSDICFEAVNKKQEFGGGLLSLSKVRCKGPAVVDSFSRIIWDNNVVQD